MVARLISIYLFVCCTVFHLSIFSRVLLHVVSVSVYNCVFLVSFMHTRRCLNEV